ncbi:MAG: nitroreductase family protein, partial [Pseudomonadota bacterium]
SPLVLAVIAKPRLDKLERIPLLEQQLSAGAVCSHILIAAGALGYGAQWLTGDPAYDPAVHAALDLGEHDAIAGFMHLGTPEEPPKERPRPDLADVVQEWAG